MFVCLFVSAISLTFYLNSLTFPWLFQEKQSSLTFPWLGRHPVVPGSWSQEVPPNLFDKDYVGCRGTSHAENLRRHFKEFFVEPGVFPWQQKMISWRWVTDGFQDLRSIQVPYATHQPKWNISLDVPESYSPMRNYWIAFNSNRVFNTTLTLLCKKLLLVKNTK